MWTLAGLVDVAQDPPVPAISGGNSSPRPLEDLVEVGELGLDPAVDPVPADVAPDAVDAGCAFVPAPSGSPRGAPPPARRRRMGFTVSAQSPSSSCAPVFSESTRTPSRSLTSGASLATRFMPSKIAFTRRTSYCLYAATARGRLSSIRTSSGSQSEAEAIVDRPCGALDGAEVLRVLGDVLARRIEQREHGHASCSLGMRFEEELVGAEAANDVLRRVRAVDADDEELCAARPRCLLLNADGLAPRELVELGGIDGDRPHARTSSGRSAEPLRSRNRPPRPDVLAGPQEVPPPALRVEADHVVRQQALVDRAPDRLGQDAPVVGLRPRDVDEVAERRRRARPPACEPGRE